MIQGDMILFHMQKLNLMYFIKQQFFLHFLHFCIFFGATYVNFVMLKKYFTKLIKEPINIGSKCETYFISIQPSSH